MENRTAVNAKQLQRWNAFYRKYGLTKETGPVSDFAPGLTAPRLESGYDQLLLIPQGLSMQAVFEVCAAQFRTQLYTHSSLDEVVTNNDRNSYNDSAVRVGRLVEPDPDLANMSADDLREQGYVCVTLMERLVHELWVYDQQGIHLDVRGGTTICAGSRDFYGQTPFVLWDGDEMSVYFYRSDYRDKRHRGRRVLV